MSLPTESVTASGSGLVFINSYGDGVTAAYRSAAITAEHYLQGQFSNPVTISVDFELAPLSGGFIANNAFATTQVSYAQLTGALRSHALTSNDQLAVNGLPATDPSAGAGYDIPVSEARILGLAQQTNSLDVVITLNSNDSWSFGQDAAGAIEHELTEGGFGRIGSLGYEGSGWAALDLFRFDASGNRDYSGGKDGVPTFFGLDSSHVTGLQYHSSISATGKDDGFDLGDWDHTVGDSFGPAGPGSPGTVSTTDLQVLDVLGWTPTSAETFAPQPDDYASSFTDTAHTFGQLSIGSSTSGALEQAGDRDWFSVHLQAGQTYVIGLSGEASGAGTLADPYLRLHDSSGALIASNDDIVDGDIPDSRLIFTSTTGGAYFVEAGAFADGYAGSYKVSLTAVSPTPTGGGDVLAGVVSGPTISAGAGDDTIYGADTGGYLRGDDGNDSVSGGAGFDDINGNKGDDTIDGGSGGNDWLVGGQGNDLITSHHSDDILYGNMGADTLMGGDGNEIIRGGQGNDVLYGGDGADWMSGDLGSDTLFGGAGADTFHISKGAGLDQVMDFTTSEGDRVQVDAGTTYTVSQVGADTVIDLGGGDQMVLKNVQLSSLPAGWIFTE